ncbi:MAG: hypothetical protein EHM36_05295 [Deltaproteobacteria bacterium]|nr:MAG: hypothetical protein EHM36_05295 [Deltaproteobacteria bacterium]
MTTDVEKQFIIAIAKSGGRKKVSLLMEMDPTELSRKLNGERGWKIHELQRFCEITGMKISSETNGQRDGNGQADDFNLILELSKKLTSTMEELREVKSTRKNREASLEDDPIERKGE